MILLLAAMMAAQSSEPVAAPVGAPVEVTGIKKKKPKQNCQYVEVSGSRMPKRVCSDASGDAERLPGIQDASANPGMLHAMPGAAANAPGGMGSPPK